MAGPNPTPEEEALLSDAELEALKDDSFVDQGEDEPDEEDGGAAADAADALAAAEPDAPTPAPAPVPAATAAPAAETPAHAPAPAPAAVEEQAPAPEPAGPTLQQIRSEYTTKIETLRNEKLAISQKFDDGDLTMAEADRQKDALDEQLTDLRVSLKTFETSIANARDDFITTHVPTFLTQHPEYKGPMYDALEAEVKRLQTAALEAGRSQHSPKILAIAHANIEKALGRQPAPTPAGGAPKPRVEGLPPRTLPPNIAELPSSDAGEDLGQQGKFAYLDRLADIKPLEYENAVAAMSDAERQAYLSA